MAATDVPLTRREQQLTVAALTCAAGHPELIRQLLVLEFPVEVQAAPRVGPRELIKEIDDLCAKLRAQVSA